MGFDTALTLGNGIQDFRHPVADVVPHDILDEQTGKQDTNHRIEQVEVVSPVLVKVSGQHMLDMMNDPFQDNSSSCRANPDQKTDDQDKIFLFYMLVPP